MEINHDDRRLSELFVYATSSNGLELEINVYLEQHRSQCLDRARERNFWNHMLEQDRWLVEELRLE
jgi:hypothetical protein